MAEFVEVMKNKNRMCKSHDCSSCAISSIKNTKNIVCEDFIINYPQEAEEIIMAWAKEHPIKTNADKFKEVFGLEPNKGKCPFFGSVEECSKHSICCDCELNNFWSEEYKEPKEV